jgi:hypothetical protein
MRNPHRVENISGLDFQGSPEKPGNPGLCCVTASQYSLGDWSFIGIIVKTRAAITLLLDFRVN